MMKTAERELVDAAVDAEDVPSSMVDLVSWLCWSKWLRHSIKLEQTHYHCGGKYSAK